MPKPAVKVEFKKFGVYQLETGSLTLGETRFVPLRAVGCDEDTAALACEDTSPVKFFDSLDEANKNAAVLKAKFDLKRNPKKKEE